MVSCRHTLAPDVGILPYQGKRQIFFLIYVHESSRPRYFLLYLRSERPMMGQNNYDEFATIRNQAGLNSFTISDMASS